MSHQEFTHLRTFQNSVKRRFRPAKELVSRRSSKHPSVGKVYKDSRVLPQVNVERVFNKPGWVKEQYL